jgi:hypothetical protein
MKNLVNLFSFLITISIFSQTWQESIKTSGGNTPFNNINGTNSNENLVGNQNEWSKISGMLAQFDDIDLVKRSIVGSVYLYNDWSNDGAVYVGDRKFSFKNMNYHIEKGKFMTRIGVDKDSTFVIDNNQIKKVIINNKHFKNIYSPSKGEYNYFEVVFDGDKISLLKSYAISFKERSPNPMVNRPLSEIKKKRSYYILKDNNLELFKLKKRSLFSLVKKNKQTRLKKEIKKYNLNYKKELDLKLIFKYLNLTID